MIHRKIARKEFWETQRKKVEIVDYHQVIKPAKSKDILLKKESLLKQLKVSWLFTISSPWAGPSEPCEIQTARYAISLLQRNLIWCETSCEVKLRLEIPGKMFSPLNCWTKRFINFQCPQTRTLPLLIRRPNMLIYKVLKFISELITVPNTSQQKLHEPFRASDVRGAEFLWMRFREYHEHMLHF